MQTKTHINLDRDLTVFCLKFRMSLPLFVLRHEVLLIFSCLESQTEWAVFLKDMIGVNFEFFPRFVFLLRQLECQK